MAYIKFDEKDHKIFFGIGKSLQKISDAIESVAYGDRVEDMNHITFHERFNDMNVYLKDLEKAVSGFEEKFFRQPIQIKKIGE